MATRQEKQARWRETIKAWRESGESKAGFCRERELKLHQFHYWCRRLAELDEAVAEPAFVEVVDGATEGHTRGADNGLEIWVGEALAIRGVAGADAATLHRVLDVAIAVAGGTDRC